MKTLTVEWVFDGHIHVHKTEAYTLIESHAVPVVRLAEVDAVIAEAVWAMELVKLREYQQEVTATVIDPHSEIARELLLGNTTYKRAHAFLASPVVTDWEQRKKKEGV
jgi:predicted P-loop ATPase/GTPase